MLRCSDKTNVTIVQVIVFTAVTNLIALAKSGRSRALVLLQTLSQHCHINLIKYDARCHGEFRTRWGLKCLAFQVIDGDFSVQYQGFEGTLPASGVAGHPKISAAYAHSASRLFNVHTHLIL